MVMMLFGGMSKGERTRVQVRTKAAMQDLASTTDRFLGGRPPYGYQLVDAGPHPNPGKAASGQRAHRLVADPVTAPVVQLIFKLCAEGHGLRSIAQKLTDAGHPSPSAHDPRRNPHRDPRGWSYASVRAILQNETYTGVRVWGKQEKFETLIDPEDVGAGYVTRMRWRNEDTWVRSTSGTHPALISNDLFAAARGQIASPTPTVSRAKRTERPYQLRGVLFCVHCGRRMQGAWRSNRDDRSSGRLLYRCTLRGARTVPPELQDHPRSLYVREDAIVPSLDAWIAKLTNPETLASTAAEAPVDQMHDSLRRQIAELDRKITALVAAVETGGDIEALTARLRERSREREGLLAQMRARSAPSRPTPAQIEHAIQELGGIATILAKAEPLEKAKLYLSLDIRLEYDHAKKLVTATAGQACVQQRVRRGT